MGVLTAGSISGPGGDPGPIENVGPGITDDSAAADPPESTKPDPKDFVPFERIEKPPARQLSRREQAIEDQISTRMKEAETRWEQQRAQEREQWQQQVRQQAEAIARTQGELEAIRRMPVPQPATPAAQGPDPDDLRRQARKALDVDKDFDAYERLSAQALRVEMQREYDQKLTASLTEFRKNLPPPPLPPQVQALVNRHEHVAMKGDAGLRLVWLKDQELETLYGGPPGPRLARAFELVNNALKPAGNGGAARQGYDPSAAAALAAAPTTRPAGGGGGGGDTEGYTPTQLEKETAKNAGMPVEEYVRWKFPERFANQRR